MSQCIRRFDEKHSKTPLVDLDKPKKTNPLHVLEESINPTPLQKTIEEVNILNNTLLEARSVSHTPGKEGREIFFSK